jgi:hypothetical protein
MSKSLINTGLWTSSQKYGNSILKVWSIFAEKNHFSNENSKKIQIM